jgi:1-acyl-sn-glycerol-3-phosphate acyltransferase
MELDRAHELARTRGVNPLLYWLARILLRPLAALYLRLEGFNADRVPSEGPVLIAANHRSFSDPFVIGLCIPRRLHFMAKAELFDRRWKARLLLALGAFPVRRGEADEQAVATAGAILRRGGVVGIFPEGTRVRPGPLGKPKCGAGRLALETGAAVVPAAVIGTEDIRRGWRFRPRKVRVRFGRPLAFPCPVDGEVTSAAAREVTARVWSSIELQWEGLGGMAPIRSAAVVGAGSWGTAIAVLLARGGATVQLGCRTAEQATTVEERRVNERYLPGVRLPEAVKVARVDDLDLAGVDLVCVAVPSRALPETLGTLAGRVPAQTGMLVTSKGLVAPMGELPCEFVRSSIPDRPLAFLAGPAHALEATVGETSLVVATGDRSFGAKVVRLLREAGAASECRSDLTGVQLAACGKNAAALAAAAAIPDGLNAAGASAGRVFAECHALARHMGASAESFTGVSGTGDLVATVLASQSRNRRAGELLALGASVPAIEVELGQAAEGIDLLPLLAAAIRRAGLRAPEVERLAALVETRRREEVPPFEGELEEERPEEQVQSGTAVGRSVAAGVA